MPRQQPQMPRQQPQMPRQQPQMPRQPNKNVKINETKNNVKFFNHTDKVKRNTFTNNPEVWGPELWNIIHSMSFMYPSQPSVEEQNNMYSAVKSLPTFLPCYSCKQHAGEYIKNTIMSGELENAVKNSKNLFLYFFNFHNAVNKKLNKPQFKLEHAIQNYDINRQT